MKKILNIKILLETILNEKINDKYSDFEINKFLMNLLLKEY